VKPVTAPVTHGCLALSVQINRFDPFHFHEAMHKKRFLLN